MIKKLSASLLLVSALFSCNVSANVSIEYTDWLSAGDNQVTIIDDTGFEWLNLNQSLGYSVNSAQAQMGQGGIFEGWRLPTYEDMQALQMLLLPSLYNSSLNVASVNVVYNDYAFIGELFGMTTLPSGQIVTWGRYQTNELDRAAVFGRSSVSGADFSAPNSGRVYSNYSALPTSTSPGHVVSAAGAHDGIYMIRDITSNASISSDVSSGGLGALMLMSLSSLALASRRRKHK